MPQQVERMRLFPYQEIGASFMAGRNVALLADEPGLGKTAQAIMACAQAIPPTVATPVIGVVCPASVRGVWAREFGRFWPKDHYHPEVKLVIESYDKIVRGAKMPEHLDALILDEGHYLKSKDAKRTKVIYGEDCDCEGGLVNYAERVYVLTGTPTPNNSSELWPMLRALAPELILGKNGRPLNYWAFVGKFCRTQDNGFGVQIVGNKNSDELKGRIAPFVLRRRKVDVLKDLPPILFDTLPVSGKITDDSATFGFIDDIQFAETDDDVVEVLRKHATHVASLRRLTGLAKVPGVVEWVKEWFEGGGGKLVIFAHHRDVIKAINTDPSLNKILRCCVTGDTPPEKRAEHVDAFQAAEGPAIFIGQIQAAGTGITLTASSDVLFAESSWVPSDNQQAAMRVHRIGQKNACTVRFATLANSIDERIQAVVARKTADIAQLFC